MYVVQLCTYLDLADFLFSFLFFSWHIAFRWEVVGNKGPSCLLLVHVEIQAQYRPDWLKKPRTESVRPRTESDRPVLFREPV